MVALSLGTGSSMVFMILVGAFILLALLPSGWSIYRRQPRAVRMKMTRWFSFEAEWDKENDDGGPNEVSQGDRPAA